MNSESLVHSESLMHSESFTHLETSMNLESLTCSKTSLTSDVFSKLDEDLS